MLDSPSVDDISSWSRRELTIHRVRYREKHRLRKTDTVDITLPCSVCLHVSVYQDPKHTSIQVYDWIRQANMKLLRYSSTLEIQVC